MVGKAELDEAQAERGRAARRGSRYAQQQIGVAESQVNLQKTNLADMVVRAPFSGIVISKDAQPGEMISPVSAGGGFTRTGIGTIVDMSSLEIEVDVNETYINRVTPRPEGRGDPRRLPGLADSGARHHDDPDGRSAEGDGAGAHRASTSWRSADPARHGREGVVPARRAGGRRQAAPAAPRVLVPKSAVRTADGKSIVFVLKDDRVERRAVSVGLETRRPGGSAVAA